MHVGDDNNIRHALYQGYSTLIIFNTQLCPNYKIQFIVNVKIILSSLKVAILV